MGYKRGPVEREMVETNKLAVLAIRAKVLRGIHCYINNTNKIQSTSGKKTLL